MTGLLTIVTASVTPALAGTLAQALRRTVRRPYAFQVLEGGETHGQKLDRALANLTHGTLVIFDDDAAPMQVDWYEWLRERMGSSPWGGFDRGRWGLPHVSGACYDVAWLRDQGASFLARSIPQQPEAFRDVGESIGAGGPLPFLASPMANPPEWLRGCYAAADDRGALIFAHLGGGTIGSVSSRMATADWPAAVAAHLDELLPEAVA